MPVFTGGSLGGQSEEAEARVRILDSRIEEAMQQVAFETRTAHLRLQNSLESIPTQKLRVDYAREAVRLARARYSERLGTIVELTQSEVALAEAEAAAVAGVYQAKIAHAELRLAIARR
jgi:outer membrane protein